jgi:hypothetical protein
MIYFIYRNIVTFCFEKCISDMLVEEMAGFEPGILLILVCSANL